MFNRIKDLREDHDLTQTQVANFLCFSQQQYSRCELGINELSYDTLIKLAILYNTSIDYILGITNDIKPYDRNENYYDLVNKSDINRKK